MRSTVSMSRTLVRISAIAVALAAPLVARAQDSATARAVVATATTVATDRIAEQLGAKLANAQPTELAIGTSATGILADPARLAALGVRDVKAGARVTIMRSARDRVRVEVDEFEPVARTRRLALHLDPDGRLSVATP